MIWLDIILEEEFTDKVIKKKLGIIFKISDEYIYVVSNYDEFPSSNPKQIVCLKTKFNEGFKMLLSIYLFDEAFMNSLDIDDFTFNFAASLKTRCLISIESNNPYLMYLYDAQKVKKEVYIDENKFDDKEIYSVLREK